jgi:hypothetical protein
MQEVYDALDDLNTHKHALAKHILGTFLPVKLGGVPIVRAVKLI